MMIDPASMAFDVDGVIADTMALFIEIAHDKFHIDGIRYEDITSYDLTECLDMDTAVIDAVVTRILDGNHQARLKPIAGAPEVVARIGRYHRPLVFVTARPYVGPIHKWLVDTLPFDSKSIDIIATGSFEAKVDVLVERNISYFVEDRLDTCYGLQAAGVVPVLYTQPWNRQRHPFVEVGSWRELEALIDFGGN